MQRKNYRDGKLGYGNLYGSGTDIYNRKLHTVLI